MGVIIRYSLLCRKFMASMQYYFNITPFLNFFILNYFYYYYYFFFAVGKITSIN